MGILKRNCSYSVNLLLGNSGKIQNPELISYSMVEETVVKTPGVISETVVHIHLINI